jgi:hypothetical protein
MEFNSSLLLCSVIYPLYRETHCVYTQNYLYNERKSNALSVRPSTMLYISKGGRNYDVPGMTGKLLCVRNFGYLGRVLHLLESLCQLITHSPVCSLIPVMVSNYQGQRIL